MANGHPKFGGSNGVPALDIGQPGGTRAGAGDARATIQVEVAPERDRRTEHTYAQENLVHEDRMGFAGGEIVWEVNLHTKDLATQRAIFSDLNTEGVATVIATIVSLSAVILGIAIEDAGEKAGGNPSTSSG